MKTPRERFMAFLALGVVVFTLLALLYFFYYDSNMTSLANQLKRIDADQRSTDEELDAIEKGQERLKAARELSLPADMSKSTEVKNAEGDYQRILTKMLYNFGSKTSVKFKESATAAGAKRPPMLHLIYEVKVFGNEIMLTDFLEKFYRMPVLHRIKTLNVQRPTTRTNDQIPEELEIAMTIEALILDGVKAGKTFPPKGIKDDQLPSKPARSDSQYAMIPGRNIFYGPESPIVDRGPKQMPFDLLTAIKLDEITIDERGCVASLYDAYNDQRYTIRTRRQDGNGPFRIDTYWYLNEAKPKRDVDHIGDTHLNFKDPVTNKDLGPFTPIHIANSGIILEDRGEFYFVHVGYVLKDARPIGSDDPEAKWVPVSTPKKDDKEKMNSSQNQQKKIMLKSGQQ